MQNIHSIRRWIWLAGISGWSALAAVAQSGTFIPLNDFSAFRTPPSSWTIAGSASADPDKNHDLRTSPGAGILANLPVSGGADIYTQLEHGDIDLELEFMMAKGSNSGVYLQGKYEIQLLDSWGKDKVTFGDCGGVYERWIEEKQQGYEGYAPRVNVSRAPGLWQKMEISFSAPRFDQYGRKKANARLLRVALNGVTIHENLELTGPTRGGGLAEAARGPLRIQGDHGPVAFRNIRYRLMDNPPLQLKALKWEHFATNTDYAPDLSTLKPKATGNTPALTHEVIDDNAQFTLRFTGKLPIEAAGDYTFDLQAYGTGALLIDGKPVTTKGWWFRNGTVNLNAGEHKIEIIYTKKESWWPNGLGLYVEGPGIRRQALHTESSVPLGQMARQIFLDYENNPVLMRCFIDYRQHPDSASRRITHAISVGFPEKMAYSYDLSTGALLQVWRGGFLNATPMWDDRGDGSSQPNGSVVALTGEPQLAALAAADSPWPVFDKEQSPFRPRGYDLDPKGIPSYNYDAYGWTISDKIAPTTGGKLERSIACSGAGQGNLYLRIANARDIKALSANRYLVDGSYFIEIAGAVQPVLRNGAMGQELLVPLTQGNAINYQLIW